MSSIASGPGLRYPPSKKTIYDRNLHRTSTSSLSRASFAFLFIEMISYAQHRSSNITDLEARLSSQGYPLGLKLLDLLLSRNTALTRPTRVLALLQFVTTTLWKSLFGRNADNLERSAASKEEYMISDNEPLVSGFVSTPREMSQLNTAAYVAGVIEGVCDGAGFRTVSVSAHWTGDTAEMPAATAGGKGEEGKKEMWPGKTVFLIRFAKEVLEREEVLGKAG